jgi:hypothetical protein
MGRQVASTFLHVQAQNFARLTFRDDLERMTADFAIRREPLKSRARVYHDLEGPPAERALN